MELTIFQIDAFTRQVFSGNPAAVIVLDQWLDDALLQNIALENNLSETAYVKPCGDTFEIRWFTPQVEVDLCGHATLAAAYVLFKYNYTQENLVRFKSQSGELAVFRQGDLLKLDFPARPGNVIEPMAGLEEALGAPVKEVYQSRDTMVVLESQKQLAALAPDFVRLARIDTFAVLVTAPGDSCDFVSRFFAPAQGINEDPVTGSAHCTLVPYWSQRLNQKELHCRQLSFRGGELFCEDLGERVSIGGYCREFLQGTIFMPA